jgi:hypothetical protein
MVEKTPGSFFRKGRKMPIEIIYIAGNFEYIQQIHWRAYSSKASR